MRNEPLLTVCVTTYKRPRTLSQLIASFIAQDYAFAELLIVDDYSGDDETEKMVRKYQVKNKKIRYIKNKQNLGFCKNLLQGITLSRGKYVFLLGDDDLILGENTLKTYVDIFEKNKNIGFIYSNIIQFNDNLSMDYFYNFFAKDTSYMTGEESIRSIWLKSTFIGGLGLRKTPDIEKLFPKENILFPQVELIGKLLMKYSSYGISKPLIGARVHKDQLGFHMMNNKRTTGNEKHANIELYAIGDEITKKSKVKKSFVEETVSDFMEKADNSVILAEGLRTSKSSFLRTIFSARKKEKRVKHTPVFWVQLCIYLLLPQAVVVWLKEIYRSLLKMVYWQKEVQYFNLRKKKILTKVITNYAK